LPGFAVSAGAVNGPAASGDMLCDLPFLAGFFVGQDADTVGFDVAPPLVRATVEIVFDVPASLLFATLAPSVVGLLLEPEPGLVVPVLELELGVGVGVGVPVGVGLGVELGDGLPVLAGEVDSPGGGWMVAGAVLAPGDAQFGPLRVPPDGPVEEPGCVPDVPSAWPDPALGFPPAL
jgi:hypothetical protein